MGKNIYRYHTYTPARREEKGKGTDFGSPVLEEKRVRLFRLYAYDGEAERWNEVN